MPKLDIFIVNWFFVDFIIMINTRLTKKYDLLVVTGPTASGKTALASAIEDQLDGEIVSADSRQVYRRMDIGTGKDYEDYIVSGKNIPVHLIDVAEAGTRFNLFEYRKAFVNVYADLKERNVFPVICGGTGLYIDSIVSAYRILEVPGNPELREFLEQKSPEELKSILLSYRKPHNTTDFDTRKRTIRAIEIEEYTRNNPEKTNEIAPLKSLIAGVLFDRETRRSRITERLHQRISAGMIDEVNRLIESGVGAEDLIYYGLEYKYITHYLTGTIGYEEMVHKLEIAIHQYSKRQMTWFRGMERKGMTIHWIDGHLPLEEKVYLVLDLLAR